MGRPGGGEERGVDRAAGGGALWPTEDLGRDAGSGVGRRWGNLCGNKQTREVLGTRHPDLCIGDPGDRRTSGRVTCRACGWSPFGQEVPGLEINFSLRGLVDGLHFGTLRLPGGALPLGASSGRNGKFRPETGEIGL
ncbi:hypothetical protein NDU88_010550 [Pleurodeles waltl]|uniref:Uncharacterized protein n=1 Tax=Pleurodeles waltl TaxID=8319 RepID=A0AAV7QWR8_PLEWA|nr:hypothetical protein NDU88_010550 [Pleurodeles waltl]